MRIFELLLLLATAAAPFVYSFSKDKKWQNGWLILLIALVAVHLVVEQARWQLIPLYIAVLLTPLYAQLARKSRIWLTMGIILLLLLGATLGTLLPIFKLPTPSGSYSIGSTALYLEDASRKEDITPDPNDVRRLAVKIWYPSETQVIQTETYLGDGIAQAFGAEKKLPGFIFSHLPLVKTHTQQDLPILDQRSPLIVLSHGYTWNAELYTALAETLTSEGYIVAGLQHTYESPLVIWKEERYVPIQDYFLAVNEKFDFGRYKELEAEFEASTDESEQLALMREMMEVVPYDESIDRWTADISFTIDELIRLNETPDHVLYQKIAIDQIAAVGHSFGGSAVAQACAYDTRIKAGINMDGAQFGKLIDTSFTTPFLAFYAERDYDNYFTTNFFTYKQTAKGPFHEVFFRGSGHASFGDLGYWTPMHVLTETGTVDPEVMQESVNKVLLGFFDQYVLEKTENWTAQTFSNIVTIN